MAQLMAVLAIGLFAGAAAADLRRRRIPNELALALAALGLVRLALAAGSGAGPLAGDAAAAAGLFALGAVVFRFGLLGGGDVKLLAAGALWVGAAQLYPYLFATAIAGGALALGFLLRRRLPRPDGGRRAQVSLPYGVAIAAGGILTTAANL